MHIFKNRAVAVIGAAALLIGLGGIGGAVAAGQIGSNDIADNSIKSKDVQDGALKSRDLHANLRHALQGTNGQDGQDGEDGADGNANPSAAGAGYETVWPADGNVHETVETCADGEYVTGGGYSTFGSAGLDPVKDLGGDNADIQITVNAPYVASDAAYDPISDADSRFYADRWVVRGYNHGATEQVVRAWALCAPVPATHGP